MGINYNSTGITSTGHFELHIDGNKTTHFLKSVDGGWIKAALVKENVGADNQQIKHHSTVEIDAFSIEIGMAGSKELLQWIRDSWRKEYGKRSGMIQHANLNLKTVFEHEFSDALVLETQFPTCDAKSKETAYLKAKLLPEHVKTRMAPGSAPLNASSGVMQRQWACAAFRFSIDGVDGSEYTNKIESFTVKQGVQKHYKGKNRFPVIVPTKIEYPTLTGTINLEFADGFMKWHDEVLAKEQGKSGLRAERTGTLEFLGPDREEGLFAVHFYGLGLSQLSIVSSTANADNTKMLKFELAVNHMELDDYSGMDSGKVG